MRPTLDAVEIMVDSVAGARAAVAGGATRIELCIAPGEGGLTPNHGLVESVLGEGVLGGLGAVALVRPRRGDFVYDADEIAVMSADIRSLISQGIDGVVIGAATVAGTIDTDACRRLIDAAAGEVQLVFHRAIDVLADPLAAIDVLVELGFDRVLTSGGRPSAPEGAEMLRRMRERAGAALVILAGGGVKPANLDELLRVSGVRQVHSSASRVDAPVADFSAAVSMASPNRPGEYDRVVTDGGAVVALVG